MIWATVYSAWGLSKPRNISNMFGSWLHGIQKFYKSLVLVRAVALCWSVWLCKNAVIFLEQTLFFFVDNILDYKLAAPYIGYLSTGYFPGGACGGISVLGAGGQGVFYPDTWMAA